MVDGPNMYGYVGGRVIGVLDIYGLASGPLNGPLTESSCQAWYNDCVKDVIFGIGGWSSISTIFGLAADIAVTVACVSSPIGTFTCLGAGGILGGLTTVATFPGREILHRMRSCNSMKEKCECKAKG